MQTFKVLQSRLKTIDGKDYGAYQSLKGEYAYPDFRLFITQIPKDPYAPPHTGIYRIHVTHTYLGFPTELITSKTGEIAYRDYLARLYSATAEKSLNMAAAPDTRD